jgi:hypothetical protein
MPPCPRTASTRYLPLDKVRPSHGEAAEPWAVALSAAGAPQCGQNRAASGTGMPQLMQNDIVSPFWPTPGRADRLALPVVGHTRIA